VIVPATRAFSGAFMLSLTQSEAFSLMNITVNKRIIRNLSPPALMGRSEELKAIIRAGKKDFFSYIYNTLGAH